MPSVENEDEEFDFYVKFAKPLVLSLPNTNDRIKAATWVRYLKKDTTDPVQRTEYLKLLLFVLQRRRLYGPFATVPDENRPLEKFPAEINIQDVAKNFVEIDKKILEATLQRGGYGEWPPYNVACSSDLTEYSASQEIPNFGVQCYYAVSTDPLQYWNHSEKALFPIGERMETLQPDCPLIDTGSPDISCFVSGDQPDSFRPSSPRPTPRISPHTGQKDTKSKDLDDVTPKTPKKESSPSGQLDEYNMERRVPPSWGSNLVNVKDSPPPISPFAVLSPISDIDIAVSDQDMLDFYNDDIDLDEADEDEALSYLQGDKLSSPERPRPLMPARPTSPERPRPLMPARPTSPERPRPLLPARPTSPERPRPLMPARPTSPERPQRPLSPEVVITQVGALSPDGPDPTSPCGVSPKGVVLQPRVKTPPAPCRIETPKPRTPPTCRENVCPKKFPQTPPQPKRILSPDENSFPPKKFPQTPPSPKRILDYVVSDKEMLDFFNESLPLPEDDPAFFLQGDELVSPVRPITARTDAKMSDVNDEAELKKLEEEIFGHSGQRTPVKVPPSIPKPVIKPSNYFQKRLAELERQLLSSPEQEVAATVQEALDEMNQPTTIEHPDRSGVGLGGDSFIAPDKKDYGWFTDLPPQPGLPLDEQQDPALWESFGWWTHDPDEIFMQMTPSPRGKRVEPDDPYAADRERWAENAPYTPPIFSRDPRIREGPAAQRQYNIEEFGMLSFEEPVWTAGEQYFKHKKEFSPYTDPRDIDRKTLDPSQFPKYESPTLKRRFSDIQGSQDEEQMFVAAPPDFADISFTEQDNRPMTRVEAKWEAIRHGPQHIGRPRTPKQKTPETGEGHWANIAFLEKTPPAFMLEPPFLATPPAYEPNQQIDVDNLEDSIGKYIEEDLKIINAKIPVTTPQRSSSPKRPTFLPESPPFVPEIDVEPDPYIPSPEKIPDRYVAQQKKLVSWNANIGTPLKFKQSEPIILESEDELLNRNLKRKNELRVMYEKQFKSPERIPTPPALPHLMDSNVPWRLPSAMPATKLPPPGWSYQTPPSLKHSLPALRQYRTPTGISPPQASPPRPQDISMYNESPPSDFLSPAMAVEALMGTPSESFGAEFSSPVRQADIGKRIEDFVVHPKPGHAFRVKTPPKDIFAMAQDFQGLDDNIDLYETPPGERTPVARPQTAAAAAEPVMSRAELDAEIAALEAELGLLKTPEQRARLPGPDEVTPELERQLWMQSVKTHEPRRYNQDKKFYVTPAPSQNPIEVKRYNPPALHTIMSPRHPKDPKQELQDRITAKAFQANREVISDMTELHKKKLEEPKHYKLKYYQQIAIQDSFFTQLRQIAYRRHKPKIDWPVSPPISPIPQPHLLDESVPEDLPRGLVRPSGWNYQTPPHLRHQIPPERVYKTPAGISPPREHKLPPKGTLFYESPPENFESPLNLDLDFSSPRGMQLPPRIHPPDRVPTARDFRPPDVLDLAVMYPDDFEGLDDEMEFYTTPPRPGMTAEQSRLRQPSPEMTEAELEAEIAALEAEVLMQTPTERRPVPANNKTPELDFLLWKESIKLHDPVEYDNRKRTWVCPAPAKVKNTMREVTGLQAPPFDAILSPREIERREFIESVKAHKPVEYERKRLWVVPGPAKVKNTMQEVTGLQAPPFDPIMSPRHPVDPEKQRQEVIEQMKFQAGREVMRDMTDLHRPWKARPKYDSDYYKRIQDDLRSRREQYARSEPVIQSPASPLQSPVPPPHLLDDELPEGLPPGLLPPSGWNWQTPPNLKFKMPFQRKYQTPTGITPPRPKGVAMFAESPPSGFDSSILDSSATSTPRTPRQIRTPSPPLRLVPAGPDVFNRAMMHPEDFQSLDAEPLELYETPPGLRIPSPNSPPRAPHAIMMPPADRIPSAAMMPSVERMPPAVMMPSTEMMPTAAYQGSVHAQTRTPPRGPDVFDMAMIGPEGFVDLLDLSPVDLYESPTGSCRPRQEIPTTSQITKEELDAEIAALEAELGLLQTPEQRARVRVDPDVTPELDRQLWIQSVKMHDPVKYKRNKKFYVCDDPAVGLMEVVGWNPPQLETIMSPRHPVDPGVARQEQVQAMGFAANREVMKEIQKQWQTRQEVERDYNDRYYENMQQFDSPIREHREREMRKYKPKIAWPASPPEVVPTHVPPPAPEALPGCCPSGWTYQTPPNMRYKIPPVRKPREPTGYTPPRVIPRGVGMFNESPPADLYTSVLEDSPELSPYRTPERIPQAEGYAVPDILDIAGYYPDDFEGFDDSPVNLYESPQGLTPSPRQQAAAEPVMSKAQLDAEIAALEAELDLLKTPELAHSYGENDITPELDRRLWMESIKLHDPVRYNQDKKFHVAPAPAKGTVEVKRYNPPALHTIMSPRHPKDPKQELQDRITAKEFQANREVMSDMTALHKKKLEEPKHYKLKYYQQKAIQDSFFTQLRQIAYRRHKPKLNLPPSPPEVLPPPGPPLHLLDEPVPEDLPRGIIRPCGWNYQTPPNLKYKVPPVRKYQTPSAVSPVRVQAPPPAGSLFYESPPLLADSPELTSLQGISDSLAMFHGSPPPELYTSPPTYQSTSPLYASPANYQLGDVSPVLFDSPELEGYLPIPPPRPKTPTAYSPKPRRIHRKRQPLDPNILYAATPKSAEKSYQPRPEPLRFEQRRPMQFRPVSPEPPNKYLETPIDPGSRPWRKRRQQPIDINLTRKRLKFDEDERQFEHEMMQQLDANLRATASRDVLNESLPEPNLDFDEIELLGDLEYEPAGFVLYQDPDAPQYNIRPAFEGQPDVDLLDTSPIRTVDQMPEDQRNFNWMGCGTRCPWS